MEMLTFSLALIVSVHDGDTLKLDDGRTIRLSGIDAPELVQPYGIESRALLRKLTRKGVTRVESCGTDRYGRMIGEIFVGRKSINRSMVERGAAWWYRKYAPKTTCLGSLEKLARERKKGLWHSSDAVSPWIWRRKVSHDRIRRGALN